VALVVALAAVLAAFLAVTGAAAAAFLLGEATLAAFLTFWAPDASAAGGVGEVLSSGSGDPPAGVVGRGVTEAS
jgi:hypothetical protein